MQALTRRRVRVTGGNADRQLNAMAKYIGHTSMPPGCWTITTHVREVNSEAMRREQKVLDAARRRDMDIVLMCGLDLCGPRNGKRARERAAISTALAPRPRIRRTAW